MAEQPWPLMATSLIGEIEAEKVVSPESLLRAHFDMLYITTRKMLEEEGRMRDVRRLTLVCHNEDKHIVKIVKD